MSAYLRMAGPGGAKVLLLDGPLVVGRAPECDLPIDDPQSSRRHARIVPQGPGALVTDLDSRNGTRINGQRIRTASLADGDVLQIGTTALRCVVESEPGALASVRSVTPHESFATCLYAPPADAVRPAQSHDTAAVAVAPAEVRVRRAGRAFRAVFARERTRFATDRSFLRTWRRRMLGAWLATTFLVVAWPVMWASTAAGRQADAVVALSAGWLAAEAALLRSAADLDQLSRDAAPARRLASIRFLDETCRVLSATVVEGSPGEPLVCRDGVPIWDGGAMPHAVARVRRSSPGEAAWVVTTMSAPSLNGRVWLGTFASVSMMAVLVWWATNGLLAGLLSPVSRLAAAASAALRDGSRSMDGSHELPELNRIAGVMAFLLARGSSPPNQQAAGSIHEVPLVHESRAPVAHVEIRTPVSRSVEASLALSDRFIVTARDGDLAAFGLAGGQVGSHVLDVMEGDAGLTNAVLTLLASASPQVGTLTGVQAVTAAGDPVRIRLEGRAAGCVVRLTRCSDEEVSRGR